MANKPFRGVRSTLLPDDYYNSPESVAEWFSTSKAYAVGDIVYYGLKLYKFTAAHAAGAWNAEHVTEITVGGNLTTLNKDTNDLKQDIEELQTEVGDANMYTLGLYPQKSVADVAMASFTDGADDIPVKSLTVDITPVQSGSGDPSPSNVRPISGWTGANIFRSSKNLFDVHDKNTDSVSISREYYLRLKPNTQYTCSSNCPQGSPANLYFGGSSTDNNGVYDGQPRTMTSDANGHIVLYVRYAVPSGSQGTINLYHALLNGTYWIQVEEGSTATEYEPVTRYNITFPTEAGTVYGGTLDVTSGVLTVTNGYVDLGTLDWATESITGGITVFYSDQISDRKLNSVNLACSAYVTVGLRSNLATTDKAIASWNTPTNQSSRVGIRDDAYSDAATFKTAMSGVQLVYELATPVTYQLTPTEVATILGQNNIFADTGDIAELTYRADLKAYIDAHVGS